MKHREMTEKWLLRGHCYHLKCKFDYILKMAPSPSQLMLAAACYMKASAGSQLANESYLPIQPGIAQAQPLSLPAVLSQPHLAQQ